MSQELSKEDKALARKSTSDRYIYTIKKIADNEGGWSLYNEGWALTGSEKKEFFPLWPTEESARACAGGTWADSEPRYIDVDYLTQELLPMLGEDDVSVAIFLLPNVSETATKSASEFYLDLSNELEKYA